MAQPNPLRSREELLGLLTAHWESEKNFQGLMLGQSVGMIFEAFSEFPDWMTLRDRAVVRQLNDLEVKISDAEGKMMALAAAFSSLRTLPYLAGTASHPAVHAAADFAALLHTYSSELVDVMVAGHKLILDIRSRLLEQE